MKTISALIAGLAVLSLSTMAQEMKTHQHQMDSTHFEKHMHMGHHVNTDTTFQFTCPMHPEVTSADPGKCPKCGMALVKNEGEKSTMNAVIYTCPMHSVVKSDKPGKCPECGMDLVVKKSH